MKSRPQQQDHNVTNYFFWSRVSRGSSTSTSTAELFMSANQTSIFSFDLSSLHSLVTSTANVIDNVHEKDFTCKRLSCNVCNCIHCLKFEDLLLILSASTAFH